MKAKQQAQMCDLLASGVGTCLNIWSQHPVEGISGACAPANTQLTAILTSVHLESAQLAHAINSQEAEILDYTNQL